MARAATVYPEHKRALLEYSVEIAGSAHHEEPRSGAYDKWSAKRSIEVRVELEAQRAQAFSVAADFQRAAGAPEAVSGDAVQALQKAVEACGSDMQCQMAAAMKYAGSGEGLAAQSAAAAEPRYQRWDRAAGGKLEIRASIQEDTDELFLTAEREHTQCSYRAQVTQAEIGELPATTIEVDTRTGSSLFLAWPVVPVTVTRHCVRSFGSQRDVTDPVIVSFMPTLASRDPVPGGTAGGSGNVITSGTATASGTLPNQTRQNDPTKVEIKYKWKLSPL